ncbi:MAG: phenylacetate--CoA ligase [Desulfobacteraceae bacterium]|nr:phenylacetate--CoA ligase family protein [Desulfobacteraceae bacterium]MBC2756551.1 phenylacetate--CoA ligase [Desulfobacteraceae bacterium]
MSFKTYFQKDMYDILNSEKVKGLQLEKLRLRMQHFYVKSLLIKIVLDAMDIVPSEITMEQFRKAVPIRLQREAAESGASMVSDDANIVDQLASLTGEDPQNFKLLCSTSGTTGDPSPYFFTEEDLEYAAQGFSRGLYLLNNGDEEKIKQLRVLQGFALSMVGAGLPAVETFIRLGIPVIPVGAEGGTEKIFYFTEKFGANFLFCTPSLAEYMLDTQPDRSKSLGLNRIMCGAEPGAGIPELREKIQTGFNCKLCDAMGLVWGVMFVSCDEDEYQGMHFLSDDLAIVELVDPDSHAHIPFENGAIGQIVLTPLVGSMPPIRVSSGDIVQVFTDPCKCGAPGWRMKVIGRSDDMLKVKGVVVYPAAIDGVITGFAPRVTGAFKILLEEPPPRVSPPLKMKVEYSEEINEAEISSLSKEIENEMHVKLKVRPQIEMVPPMSIDRATYKTNFFEKLYEDT